MNKDILKNIILAALSLILVGCYTLQSPKKSKWHEKMPSRVLCQVGQDGQMQTCMATIELEAKAGQPDFKVSPVQLEALMVDDVSYRKEVFDHLWLSYRQDKKRLLDFHCADEPGKWRDCQEFKTCSLWLYDESQHFKKPMVWGWNYRVGFTCYCFFVEQGQVVGTTGLIYWKPLRQTDQ